GAPGDDAGRPAGWSAILFPLLAPALGLAVAVTATSAIQFAIDDPPGMTVVTGPPRGIQFQDVAGSSGAGIVRFARSDLLIRGEAGGILNPGGEKRSGIDRRPTAGGMFVRTAMAATQGPDRPIGQQSQ